MDGTCTHFSALRSFLRSVLGGGIAYNLHSYNDVNFLQANKEVFCAGVKEVVLPVGVCQVIPKPKIGKVRYCMKAWFLLVFWQSHWHI